MYSTVQYSTEDARNKWCEEGWTRVSGVVILYTSYECSRRSAEELVTGCETKGAWGKQSCLHNTSITGQHLTTAEHLSLESSAPPLRRHLQLTQECSSFCQDLFFRQEITRPWQFRLVLWFHRLPIAKTTPLTACDCSIPVCAWEYPSRRGPRATSTPGRAGQLSSSGSQHEEMCECIQFKSSCRSLLASRRPRMQFSLASSWPFVR